MFKTIATIALLALLSSTAPQAQQAPLQPSPVKRTILQKSDVPGTNLEGTSKNSRVYSPVRVFRMTA